MYKLTVLFKFNIYFYRYYNQFFYDIPRTSFKNIKLSGT